MEVFTETVGRLDFKKFPLRRVISMLDVVGEHVQDFGSTFTKPDQLNQAALFYALAKNYVLPDQYLRSTRGFSNELVAVMHNDKLSSILLKGSRGVARRKCVNIVADIVARGGANQRNMIGDSSMQRLGCFVKKLKMRRKDFTSEKMRLKNKLELGDLNTVLNKMGL
ncbi:hypothetical protein FOA52_004352 [Chlamydomonas sp. UWO 241]|nr:hypothetical protein FOA52_011840 [Chlamydomonas sp. UWO 241]KAG1656966.1 hypothetical protein FOA52_004352 [Chlamydomonas sp. UWO 241]